jgi:hypothetical protein
VLPTVGGAITINTEISDEGPVYSTATPTATSKVWLDARAGVIESVTLTGDKVGSVTSVEGRIIAGQLGIVNQSGDINLQGVNWIGTGIGTANTGVFAAKTAVSGAITFVNQMVSKTDLTIENVTTAGYTTLKSLGLTLPATMAYGVSTKSGNIVIDNDGGRQIPGFIDKTVASNLIVKADASNLDPSKVQQIVTGTGDIKLNVGSNLTMTEANGANTKPDIWTKSGNILINVPNGTVNNSDYTGDLAATSHNIFTSDPRNQFFINGAAPAIGQFGAFNSNHSFIIKADDPDLNQQITGIGPLVKDVSVSAISSAVNVDTHGTVSITLTLFRPNESGIHYQVNWGDGKPTDPATVVGSKVTFSHTYDPIFGATRPDANGDQTAPIFVTITLSNSHITFDPTNVANPNATVIHFGLMPNSLTGFLTDQLQATERPNLIVAESVPPPVPPPAFPQIVVLPLEEQTFGGRLVKDTFGVPILQFVHPDGSSHPMNDRAELTFEQFRELLNKDLRGETWARFPDGHYRILLKPTRESTTERVVLDVYVRQGKVIDFADLEEEPNQPPAQQQPAAPAVEQPEAGDQSRLDLAPPTIENPPTDWVAPTEFDQAQSVTVVLPAALETPPPRLAVKDPSQSARPVDIRRFEGASALGAGLALAGLRHRLEQESQVEQRRAAARPLTKAGRLYSRLRRRADELNSISE